jgi:hypothetical protein
MGINPLRPRVHERISLTKTQAAGSLFPGLILLAIRNQPLMSGVQPFSGQPPGQVRGVGSWFSPKVSKVARQTCFWPTKGGTFV